MYIAFSGHLIGSIRCDIAVEKLDFIMRADAYESFDWLRQIT